MKKYFCSTVQILGIFVLIIQLACSQAQLDRTYTLIKNLKPFIVAFHLAPDFETKILGAIDKGIEAFDIFKNSPTRGNLRKAIEVFQKFVDDGTLDTGNPTTDNKIKAAIAVVILVMNTLNPPESASSPSLTGTLDDSNIKITIDEEQKRTIDRELNKLEQMLKQTNQ